MGFKVSVVDDDGVMRDLLNDVLKDEGYRVITASSGEEALELFEGEDPQLVLMDINMPGTDGLEVCRRLKADGKTCSTPVIMMTGFSYSRAEALEAGADDLIYKPFEVGDLVGRVRSLLHRRD